jgi:hypothetical protein
MKWRFALASIIFSSALSMDHPRRPVYHSPKDDRKIMFELLVDSDWIDNDTGKLSMWFKSACVGQVLVEAEGVIQISGSKKELLTGLLNIRQQKDLKTRTPAIPFHLVRTFRWIKGNLRKITRDNFFLFPNVEEIDLHSNRIKKIDPEAFRGLTKLKKVWLDGNKLTQRHIAELKENLNHLEVLDCRDQHPSAEEKMDDVEDVSGQAPQNPLASVIAPYAFQNFMRCGFL